MLTLLLALTPFALFGMVALAVIFYEENVICRPIKPETSKERIEKYGYDPKAQMVQRFQKLAGIRSPHRWMYNTHSKSLRNRFNRVRAEV